jgi:hypothetical protein
MQNVMPVFSVCCGNEKSAILHLSLYFTQEQCVLTGGLQTTAIVQLNL